MSQRQKSAPDPYLNNVIAKLHDTPMQRKFRKLAPMPVGVVFLPWPGMTEEDARSHFRLMKELGFTCLKQTMGSPEWPTEKILELALDEGIWPFWYAEGGFEDITPELLKKLGLPADMDINAAMAHPAMLAHQKEVFRARVHRGKEGKSGLHIAGGDEDGGGKKVDPTWVPGVVGNVKGHELAPEAMPHFVQWLQNQYGTVEGLKQAWNYQHVGLSHRAIGQWQTWQDVLATLQNGLPGREYRHIRDALRFRADTFTRQHVEAKVERSRTIDPEEPVRAGGEMGLFLSFASRGTDMEQIAEAMGVGGSFYPSIHLAWHFEEVDFEVARPVYMQSQIAHDWAKGIWSATWESTGGPQYFSGGKAPFVEDARNKQPGFTTEERTMTQLMLSWLAAGFKGFGLWCWNARTAGWEAGEYALLDRNRNVTERARQAGRIGKAAVKYRRELWNAHKEPLVGILQDWENEAIWAAMGVTGRDFYKAQPVRARIGASRAFINANVPWEYVTPLNLKRGLGPRYKVIYVPAFIAIGTELQQMLLDYVKAGGRLVIDMPGAYYDEFGRVYNTDKGSLFEQTFGCVLNEFHYANTNTPYTLDGVDITPGFTAALTPTSARVVASYEQYGRPGITEARVGQGTAVVLAAQASLNCWKPGNTAMEALIVRTALGPYEAPYACENALAYRLAGDLADHYFLINDGPTATARLNTKAFAYRRWTDAVTGENVSLKDGVRVDGYSGRWLRAEK